VGFIFFNIFLEKLNSLGKHSLTCSSNKTKIVKKTLIFFLKNFE